MAHTFTLLLLGYCYYNNNINSTSVESFRGETVYLCCAVCLIVRRWVCKANEGESVTVLKDHLLYTSVVGKNRADVGTHLALRQRQTELK